MGRRGEYALLSHQRRGPGALSYLLLAGRLPGYLGADGQEGQEDHVPLCREEDRDLPGDAPPRPGLELRAALLLQLVHLGLQLLGPQYHYEHGLADVRHRHAHRYQGAFDGGLHAL